ncbi:MAG: hypothetical protein RL292_206 [Candidatus Parcubacteria bacterium]|jgi:Tfp pilus assembly protein PilX
MATQNLQRNTQSGYALFTSILLTGTLIIIAYATTNFSLKQLLLTTSGAESHAAFYVADSGVECAMYWDIKNGATSAFDASAPSASVACGGVSNTVTSGGGVSTFQLPVGSSCAVVTVTKSGGNTTIESKGYNTCSGSNRLERAIRITY